ncbi:MAG TPA: hypothetical protein PLH79_18320 [bacterium]|nr:hypothetical protein [Candidatus Omnitrophota bacterium]HOL96308.1 hypothetical protein [bacterium]HPP01588.1 hypothetical protein [bacterium]HXK95417.1 hypothetical protein [bacterium]
MPFPAGTQNSEPLPIANRHFHYLFGGLLCTQLDFRVEGWDVLFPDFIGYALFAIGLRGLAHRPIFHSALVLATGLAGFSLITLYETPSGTDFFKGYDSIHFFLMIFDLILVWQILGGIMELAKERSNLKLADTAQLRRLLYVAMAVSPLLLTALTPEQQELFMDYAVAYLLVVYGVIFLVLELFLRAGKELAAPPTPPEEERRR